MRTIHLAILAPLVGGCQTITMLSDANNFAYTGDIDAPSHETASGVNIEICWDELTDDIQCHEVDPTSDPKLITMARFNNLSEVEVEQQISDDSLDQSSLSGFLTYEIQGGETCAQLEDFTLDGTPVVLSEQYYEGGGTYLLLFGRTNIPGQNIISMDFLVPMESSEVVEVDIGPACATLDFTADLSSAESIELNAGGSSWVVDWGDLTTNGLGNPIALANIDRLLLGYYAGMSVADIEASFLDLELVATDLYYMELFNTFEADLAEATGASGDFSGFDPVDGTWVLALMCTTCSNPAPLFATVIVPQ